MQLLGETTYKIKEKFRASLIVELSESLRAVRAQLRDDERGKSRELAWMKLFDRIDLVLLFTFQTTNVIVTWVVCT